MDLKKTKNVAIFVNSEFIPSYSGAANRFHYLCRALEQHTDSRVVVFHCDRGWSDPKLIKNEPFRTYLIHFEDYKNQDLLRGIFTKENIDLMQFADLEFAIEIGIPLSHSLSIPLVFEAHFDAYEFAKNLGAPKAQLDEVQFLENTFGKYFDKIIALSSDDDSLSKNYTVQKKDIVIIPNGINVNEFPESCFDEKSKKIIFLGNLFFGVNLDSIKNIKQTMYARLKSLAYHFHIIGDISPAHQKELQDEDFIFTGKQENLSHVFSKSLIALAPVSSGAGIRIKIPTYMNAGIPVITTSEGARGFARKDLLIIEDDLEKYSDMIHTLTHHPHKLKTLSEMARSYVHQQLSWEGIAERVSTLYDKILTNRPGNKSDVIDIINHIKFDDPSWIKEIIEKNRFGDKPTAQKGQYITIN